MLSFPGVIPALLLLLACVRLAGTPTPVHAEGMTELQYLAQALYAKMREAEQSRKAGALVIGTKSYLFDTVVCDSGSVGTAIASDRRERSGYPEVRVSIFNSASASSSSNTVSVMFNRAHDRELWQLREGKVRKTNGRIEAIGYLRDAAVAEQADGILKPVPARQTHWVAFGAAIACD